MIELSDEEVLYRDVTLRSSSKQVILTDAVGICAVVDGSGTNEINKMATRALAFIQYNFRTCILRLLLLIHKGAPRGHIRQHGYPLLRR